MLKNIPKIIHLSSKDGTIPQQFLENYETIKFHFPDYKIIIHSDDDIYRFVKNEYPKLNKKVFLKFPYDIMRFDFVRYLWMHKYGGIYMDLDIKVHKIQETEGRVLFFEREWTFPDKNDISTSIHNCIFLSMPGEQIWLDICTNISKNFWVKKRKAIFRKKKRIRQKDVFEITGPNAISRVISSKKEKDILDGVTIWDVKKIYQANMSKHNGKDALVEHQVAATWN